MVNWALYFQVTEKLRPLLLGEMAEKTLRFVSGLGIKALGQNGVCRGCPLFRGDKELLEICMLSSV